jgi:hypothetical protein
MKSQLFIIIAFAILQSCSTVNVTSDWDREAKFTDYKTFGILKRDEANGAFINDFDWKRIEDSITSEMTARGYTLEYGETDLDVGVHILLENKTDVRAYTDYYGGYGYGGYRWGYGYGAYGMGGTTTTVTETDYTQGTLILNVMDAREKALIWQGIAVGTVKEGNVDREKRINKIIGQMYAQNPFKKQK